MFVGNQIYMNVRISSTPILTLAIIIAIVIIIPLSGGGGLSV